MFGAKLFAISYILEHFGLHNGIVSLIFMLENCGSRKGENTCNDAVCSCTRLNLTIDTMNI